MNNTDTLTLNENINFTNINFLPQPQQNFPQNSKNYLQQNHIQQLFSQFQEEDNLNTKNTLPWNPPPLQKNSSSMTFKNEDRYIHNRQATHNDLSKFILHNKISNIDTLKNNNQSDKIQDTNNNSQSNSSNTTQQNNGYNTALQKCILTQNNSKKKEKIGSYNQKNSKKNKICNENITQQIFSMIQSNNRNSTPQKPQRQIASTPERILDAPELKDDYYLNLIDWGSSGILAVCLNQSVYLWNSYTGQIQLLLTASQDHYISSVQWMQKSNTIAIGFSNNTIQLWDTQKKTPYRNLLGHQDRVSSMTWNNYILSSGSRDTSIINHDVRVQNNIINRWQEHTQEVCGLKWNNNGTQLASGSNDNNLMIWDQFTQQKQFQFQEHNAAVKALAWCPWQSDLLASGGGTADMCIKYWDTQQGKLVKSVKTQSQVCSLIWNPYQREIVSSHGFTDNQLTVWNYDTMEKITELFGHQNRVLHMALNPEGTTVCSAASDETLRFWNIFQPYAPGLNQCQKSDFDCFSYNQSNNLYIR